ncbi:TPA: hypothetical protein ACGO6R_002224 [Streptococcus suis]
MARTTMRNIIEGDLERGFEALTWAGAYAELIARQNPEASGMTEKMKCQLSRAYGAFTELARRAVSEKAAEALYEAYMGPSLAFDRLADKLDDAEDDQD